MYKKHLFSERRTPEFEDYGTYLHSKVTDFRLKMMILCEIYDDSLTKYRPGAAPDSEGSDFHLQCDLNLQCDLHSK